MMERINEESLDICSKIIHYEKADYNKRDRFLDKILTNKITGIPIMLMLLKILSSRSIRRVQRSTSSACLGTHLFMPSGVRSLQHSLPA